MLGDLSKTEGFSFANSPTERLQDVVTAGRREAELVLTIEDTNSFSVDLPVETQEAQGAGDLLLVVIQCRSRTWLLL